MPDETTEDEQRTERERERERERENWDVWCHFGWPRLDRQLWALFSEGITKVTNEFSQTSVRPVQIRAVPPRAPSGLLLRDQSNNHAVCAINMMEASTSLKSLV